MYRLSKISNYIVIIIIAFFILLAVYFQGLFFDDDLYLIEMIISLIFLFYIVINYKKLIILLSEPYIWLLVVIDLIFLIHSFSAVGQLAAFQQFFRWLMVTELFIFVILIKNKEFVSNLFWIVLVVTGVWTSIFGWLAAYNLVDFEDAFLSNRISSVFQYPNTFGALLAGILIAILIRGTSNKWVYSLSSISTYLLTLTIIFTYSRGTWLVLPIVWIIGLFFLSFKKQLLYIIHTLIIGIAIILTLTTITDTITTNSYQKGFIIIGITSAIIVLSYSALSFFINRINISIKSKTIRWVLPVLSIIVIIISLLMLSSPSIIEKLPDKLENRIKTINPETQSVQARKIFYKDSSELIKEGLLFGNGGGAWGELYNSYKSYPYVSGQTHNFYLQLATEIGIVGLLLFISFLLLILLSIIKNRNDLEEDQFNRVISFGSIALFLLIHSFIDFNMSYAYILGITMILLALIAYPIPYKFFRHKILSYISFVLIGIMLFISLINTSKFFYAVQVEKNIDYDYPTEASKQIEKIVLLNPYNLDYRFLKADFYYDLYEQTSNEETKQKILNEITYINNANSRNVNQVLKLSQTAVYLAYYLDAVQILEVSLKEMPWEEELYEQYFMFAFELAKYYQVNGDTLKSEELLNKIIYYYEVFLDKRKFLDSQITSLQYKEFKVSPYMKQYIGQVYIIYGEYDNGLELLIPLTKNSNEQIKENALVWTVYAYQQQNMQDEANIYLEIGKEFDILAKVELINNTWSK